MKELSTDFRKATHIVSAPLPTVKDGEVSIFLFMLFFLVFSVIICLRYLALLFVEPVFQLG